MSEYSCKSIIIDTSSNDMVINDLVLTNVEKTKRMLLQKSGKEYDIKDIFSYIFSSNAYHNINWEQAFFTIGVNDTEGHPLCLLFDVAKAYPKVVYTGFRCTQLEIAMNNMQLN